MIVIEETRQGVPVLQADGILEAGGAAHGFSTRLGGVSQGMWSSLNLGVSRGDRVTVTLEGGDEEAALRTVEQFFQEHL